MMPRRPIHFVVLLSLLVWLAIASLSIRGRWRSDRLYRVTDDGYVGASNFASELHVRWGPLNNSRSRPGHSGSDDTRPWRYANQEVAIRIPGFTWLNDTTTGDQTLVIRHWLISTVTFLLPAAALLALRRKRVRHDAGLCPQCG